MCSEDPLSGDWLTKVYQHQGIKAWLSVFKAYSGSKLNQYIFIMRSKTPFYKVTKTQSHQLPESMFWISCFVPSALKKCPSHPGDVRQLLIKVVQALVAACRAEGASWELSDRFLVKLGIVDICGGGKILKLYCLNTFFLFSSFELFFCFFLTSLVLEVIEKKEIHTPEDPMYVNNANIRQCWLYWLTLLEISQCWFLGATLQNMTFPTNPTPGQGFSLATFFLGNSALHLQTRVSYPQEPPKG